MNYARIESRSTWSNKNVTEENPDFDLCIIHWNHQIIASSYWMNFHIKVKNNILWILVMIFLFSFLGILFEKASLCTVQNCPISLFRLQIQFWNSRNINIVCFPILPFFFLFLTVVVKYYNPNLFQAPSDDSSFKVICSQLFFFPECCIHIY